MRRPNILLESQIAFLAGELERKGYTGNFDAYFRTSGRSVVGGFTDCMLKGLNHIKHQESIVINNIGGSQYQVHNVPFIELSFHPVTGLKAENVFVIKPSGTSLNKPFHNALDLPSRSEILNVQERSPRIVKHKMDNRSIKR